ncbi:prenyltransferase/squalene oxidase repeat-containing protein [Clostridium paraputrificum]|uniref:prenyltransferase/squalene oxidase repeat-containing protein n=1 Tax=Clostridium paraputrificum TaxID=29363 RepID=UPI0018989E8A|nr:prenyltransferase/squalene oxidase repeat-containing protein [Clostridium paraputrificum]MDB2109738.1 prenyltransferase/squalene oxidase repeat-containing protein [Clostridium paraputrificum]
MDYYTASKKFILKNSRPLDMARWNYLFENGSKEEVISALKAYQNDDGGFANALEPDCWNINSTPLQTWVATQIIKEINLDDKNHPIIKGILDYLSSKDEFDGHRWHSLNTVVTNDNYPHAPWCSYRQKQESTYNPTASLIGFILKYAEKDTDIYKSACELSKEAYDYFKDNFPLESMHESACFVELYDYIKECSILNLLDMKEFKRLLQKQIKQVITYDTKIWNTDYICKPSLFINSKSSDFYLENKEICDFEYQFILKTQNEDGSWGVTWEWNDYPEEWAISKNWWKSDIIIKNIKYIREFKL